MKIETGINPHIKDTRRSKCSIVGISQIVQPVWPDLAIYWTLRKFLKHLATIDFPKSPTFLGIFCKGVKIYHFSREVIFGQLL